MTDQLFAQLKDQPADGLLALMLAYRADPRTNKLDLGVGVYRENDGTTPVFAAVKAAERQLLAEQTTKVYLGVDGDLGFVERLAPVVLGDVLARDPRLAGMQTPGGTGALRLAAEFMAATGPDVTVWIGDPTWANHVPIFRAAGVRIARHPLFDPVAQRLELDAMLTTLDGARAGDAVLLHGCCHNPAGVDFTPDQWRRIAEVIERRRLVPIIDLAYHGLGRGLEEDAYGTRLLVERAEAAIVCYSCDKNFGLYRERTGALWVRSPHVDALGRVRSAMRAPARASWSMPPDHGAAVVRIILDTPELTDSWREELEAMRRRILSLRETLADAHPALAGLREQTGMFSMLPLSREAVQALRRDDGIYLADDGRANLAGITLSMIPMLVAALAPHLAG
jgi:aromatic-amino-acid transaminase